MTELDERTAMLLEEAVRRLVEEFVPERIHLVGSFARGDFRQGSDLDLVVVARASGPSYQRSARGYAVLSGLGIPVDVMVFTPEEEEAVTGWTSHVLSLARTEGVELYRAGGAE